MVRPDIDDFLKTLPQEVSVVAATKYVESEDMRILYEHGVVNFGENRVDSFLRKYESLQDLKDVKWHFIGHLQRNKARDVINKIDYLHSLDSLELAKIINEKRKEPLPTFIEVSINLEENKNGVPYYELPHFIEEVLKYPNIKLVGLMMMAYKNSEETFQEFSKLTKLRDEMEKRFCIKLPYLSMGMSDDYQEAIKAGSTHIRLGRILYK